MEKKKSWIAPEAQPESGGLEQVAGGQLAPPSYKLVNVTPGGLRRLEFSDGNGLQSNSPVYSLPGYGWWTARD